MKQSENWKKNIDRQKKLNNKSENITSNENEKKITRK